MAGGVRIKCTSEYARAVDLAGVLPRVTRSSVHLLS